MRSIPVNTDSLTFVVITCADATDNEGRRRTNNEGEALTKVQVLVTGSARDDRGELMDVSVPSAPALSPLTPVTFTDMVARSWAMGDRSGVSFSAASVSVKHESNGRKPMAAATAES